MLTKNRIKQYLQSIYTKSEQELEIFLANQFNKNYHDNYHKNGSYHFFYNNSPILLVAHLDTVHSKKPGTFYTADGYTFYAEYGIGADDRNGIVAIFEIYNKCVTEGKRPPSILFTCKEEIGGVGVRQFVKNKKMVELLKNKNIFIQFDRKGNKDFVTYGYENEILFKKLETIGFNHEYGSYTDISTLMQATDIMGVNFSAGYYKAHTKEEYTNFLELQNNINKVFNLFSEFEQQQFIATEVLPVYNSISYGSYERYHQQGIFDDYYEEGVAYILSGAELYEVIENGELEDLLQSPHLILNEAMDELYSFYPEDFTNKIIRMIHYYDNNFNTQGEKDDREDEYEFDI